MTEPDRRQGHVPRQLVTFVRSLRTAGVPVPADGSLEAARVIAAIGMTDRKRTRAALRSALVTRVEDYETFDRLFSQFWRNVTAAADARCDEQSKPNQLDKQTDVLSQPSDSAAASSVSVEDEQLFDQTDVTLSADTAGDDGESSDQQAHIARASRGDGTTHISAEPASQSEDPTAIIDSLVETLEGYEYRGRTRAIKGEYIDVRRALRESYQTGGTIVSPPRHTTAETGVRCTFLIDVSQSVLDVIDRAFLIRSLKAFEQSCTSMRTFFFDTDVREVTAAFEEPTVDGVYDVLERAEADWGGGTLIGDALTTIRDEYPFAVDRNTIVLIVSDGLETGDVDRLAEGITWHSRRSKALFWLNPLATGPSYEPTCRGMAIAEPHVEGIFGFVDEESFREMDQQLRRYTGTQPLGYQRSGE